MDSNWARALMGVGWSDLRSLQRDYLTAKG
jgi:hypothetical protein